MLVETVVSLLGPFLIPVGLFVLGTIGYVLLRAILW
jgi:hypothetical protein